jgi:hypothetical protein
VAALFGNPLIPDRKINLEDPKESLSIPMDLQRDSPIQQFQ